MLLKAVNLDLFSGFSVGRGEVAIDISHLQFADDLLIFCGDSKCQVLACHRFGQEIRECSWKLGGMFAPPQLARFGLSFPLR
ncbi:hypothetical protein V6N11_034098 [Hibiscus sabdariffa]|uniref:Reverse transcriptase domain-containing protein n=1 Tax=Hibiscus sabdariffa TaxID=183260 RepID=A0ABR2S203_9ROSI